MMFFITIALCLLYVLLGLFTDEVLVLRFLEVAIGASIGALAAFLILPIRTSHVLLNVTVEAARRLDDLVNAAVERLAGNTSADPIIASRKYDEALQSLRAQVEPLLSAPGIVSNAAARMRLTLLAACGYLGAALAVLAYAAPQDCPIDALRIERDAIHTEIERIIALREGCFQRSQARAEVMPPPDERALTYLWRIDRTLRGLERSLASVAA